ncbi:hypothetical protein M9H77_05489 [Catharanthus roseus]|uniref:Uncharacterized protein n=1 Tax=Catharanthus roseus TaxID=4058 RepID=A0ACC0CH20_CATRO|nr:hypothetical protein M9H77_05489 [Catharanthus roseus]
MAVIRIPHHHPTEPIQSVYEMEKSIENKNNSSSGGANEIEMQNNEQQNNEPQNNEQQNMAASGSSKSKSRNKNPGVRVVGGRVYDSENGKTCHQCRQKTKDLAAECKNIKKNKPCPIRYCHKCLLNRYGEKAAEVADLPDWNCPKCRGICNCSFCMKKRGCQPTGMLVHTAKAKGFSSVSEMLQVGGTNLNIEKSPNKDVGGSSGKRAASETDPLTSSSGKRVKESIADEKVEANLQSSSTPPSLDEHGAKLRKGKGKKVKVQESEEKPDLGTNDQVEGEEEKSPEGTPEVILPTGTELKAVCGIEMSPEDIGKALQFLEFCTVFEKASNSFS